MKLTAIIITKNEEKNIVSAIENLKFADEVIIVDNNSIDKTVQLARKHGARTYSKKFSDFSWQRNFGLKKARGEWILYIDADERVSDSLKHEIIKTLEQENVKSKKQIGGYRINRKNFYFGKYDWPYIEKLERLFRKDMLKRWEGKIHESSVVEGKIGKLKGFLYHYTHTDLSSMIKKTNRWSDIEAELINKAGHPKIVWWRFLRIMLTKFYYSFVKQGGWKVGVVGWIESIYQAFSYFIVYAKLWEKQNKVKSQNGKVKTTG